MQSETPQHPPLESWQFYSSCRRILKDSFLQTLFKRSLREIQRWSADPRYASDTDRNPLDRYEFLLDRLMELGRADIARASVARQAHIVGCELRCLDPVEPNANSIEAECLDDYPALTQFHEAVRQSRTPDLVRHLWQEAKRELDETFTLYSKENGRCGHGS